MRTRCSWRGKTPTLNQVRIKFVHADVFPFMRDMVRGGRQFDVVVLDPPKLIRSRTEFEEGSRKYFDLNRLAMQLVRPGRHPSDLHLFRPDAGRRVSADRLFRLPAGGPPRRGSVANRDAGHPARCM